MYQYNLLSLRSITHLPGLKQLQMLDKQHDKGILIKNFVRQKPILQSTGTALHNILTLLEVMKQETSLIVYIFFLTFIFFVTISILFLTFKVKFKIIPAENVINYYWSWINFDGKLVKKKLLWNRTI